MNLRTYTFEEFERLFCMLLLRIAGNCQRYLLGRMQANGLELSKYIQYSGQARIFEKPIYIPLIRISGNYFQPNIYLLGRLQANGLGNYQSIQYSGQPGIFGKLLPHGLGGDPFPKAVRKNNNKTEKAFSFIACTINDKQPSQYETAVL